MPRKKGSKNKPKVLPGAKTQVVRKEETHDIDSFAKVANELHLQESYKSLLLGIAVVLLVTVLTAGYLKSRNEQVTKTVQESPTAQGDVQKNVLGVHTVQAGDDLKTISTKYYQTPEMYMLIAKENGLPNPDVIEEGKQLTIPKIDKKQFIAPLLSRPAKTDPIADTTYTVQDGDLLWDIAIRAYGDGNKWQDIAKENNLVTADGIFPGMILQLSR